MPSTASSMPAAATSSSSDSSSGTQAGLESKLLPSSSSTGSCVGGLRLLLSHAAAQDWALLAAGSLGALVNGTAQPLFMLLLALLLDVLGGDRDFLSDEMLRRVTQVRLVAQVRRVTEVRMVTQLGS